MNKAIGRKKLFIAVGTFFVVIALAILGLDVYRMASFDHVSSKLTLTRGPHNRKQARVNYEYDDQLYMNIKLSGYNAITMKDGKEFTVLINPKNPGRPYTTSFIIEGLVLACGVLVIVAGIKGEEEKKS